MVGSFLLDVMLLQFRMPTDLVAKVVRYYEKIDKLIFLVYNYMLFSESNECFQLLSGLLQVSPVLETTTITRSLIALDCKFYLY
jgi:hypothetical protein